MLQLKFDGVQKGESATLETLLQRARAQAKVPVPEEKVKRCEEFGRRGSFQSSREKATDGVGAFRRPGKVGHVARRASHEREAGFRAGPRPRTGSDPFEGTSRAVAGGPDHSASDQETSHSTVGVLASGRTWSNSVDAQVGAQRRDNLVAGPPSGLSDLRSLPELCRLMSEGVDHLLELLRSQLNHLPWRTWSCVRVVVHRCGFLGCRVGEASNPDQCRRGRPGDGEIKSNWLQRSEKHTTGSVFR